MIDPYPYKKEATDLLKRLEDDALSQGFVEEDGRLYASALVGPREKLAPVLENPQVRQRLSDIAASGYRISLYPVKDLFRLVIMRSESNAGVCVYDQLQNIDNWEFDEIAPKAFKNLAIIHYVFGFACLSALVMDGRFSFVGFAFLCYFLFMALNSHRLYKQRLRSLVEQKRFVFLD